jgi:hypothetical protein
MECAGTNLTYLEITALVSEAGLSGFMALRQQADSSELLSCDPDEFAEQDDKIRQGRGEDQSALPSAGTSEKRQITVAAERDLFGRLQSLSRSLDQPNQDRVMLERYAPRRGRREAFRQRRINHPRSSVRVWTMTFNLLQARVL